jgi:hypothetical protein
VRDRWSRFHAERERQEVKREEVKREYGMDRWSDSLNSKKKPKTKIQTGIHEGNCN